MWIRSYAVHTLPHFRERTWIPDPGTSGGRRAREPFRYRAFVPDPIAELDPPLPLATAQRAGDADRAVAELNLASGLGGIEALARRLMREESVASSRIEGLALGHRRLAREEMAARLGDRADQTAATVLGNVRAMQHAIDTTAAVQRLDRDSLLEIHRALLESTPERAHAGAVRSSQNWLGGSYRSPRGAEFVPPPEDLVETLLDDLAAFLDRTDLPATVQAAIAHAQFETIHPFADGNGRVGRCLIHVVFRRAGLVSRLVPPISLVLARDGDAYVRGLTAFRTEGGLDEWVGYFAERTLLACVEGHRLANALAALVKEWLQRAGRPRRHSAAARLLEALPGQPIVDVATAAQITGASEEAARRAVLALERAGVLAQLTVGTRNRAWEAREVFDLLDTFEDEVGTGMSG